MLCALGCREEAWSGHLLPFFPHMEQGRGTIAEKGQVRPAESISLPRLCPVRLACEDTFSEAISPSATLITFRTGARFP